MNILVALIPIIIIIAVLFASLFLFNGSDDSSLDLKNKSLEEKLENTDKFIANEIQLPKTLQKPAEILFGVEENAPLQSVMISLMIWFMIFFLLANVTKTFSPFGGGTSIALAFVLTTTISIAGIINGISAFLANLSSSYFGSLTKYSTIKLIIVITALLVIWIILSKLAIALRKDREKEISDVKAIKAEAKIKSLMKIQKDLEESLKS